MAVVKSKIHKMVDVVLQLETCGNLHGEPCVSGVHRSANCPVLYIREFQATGGILSLPPYYRISLNSPCA